MSNNFHNPHAAFGSIFLFNFVPRQIPFPGQNKDKQQSGAIPGVAAPHTPPSASAVSSSASTVPKRLLTKTKRALSEADLHQASSDKPLSPSKTQGGVGQSGESEQSTQNPPPKSSIGTFHHLPHYMKLYEIIKGAYANNQVVVKYFEYIFFYSNNAIFLLLRIKLIRISNHR